MSYCYACGHQFAEDLKVYRSTECPSCGKDVKVCKNCEFYSPGSNMDCREHISEPVKDKERSNFCDYFKLGQGTASGKIAEKAEKARSDFNSLFNDE